MEVNNSYVSSYIKYFDNVLLEKTNNNFVKICKNAEAFGDATIVGFKGNENNQVVKKIRDTKVWGLTNTDNEKSYTNIHWCNLFYSAFMFNSEKYLSSFHPDRWQKVQMQDLQVLKYEVGGHYKFHVDHSASVTRTLSFIYLVNDDYEGGELVFSRPDYSVETTIEKKKNRLIIWPSNFLYPHTVKPVTKGIRYSVVGWAL